MIDNLLEFGVAINFFGNYRQETARVSDWVDGFASKMTDIAALVATGGVGAALTTFTRGVIDAGMQMEGHFAGLKSVLGTQEKVLEALAWSQQKGLETPFTTTEVLRALTTLTTAGFAANKKLREDSFDAFSDLASAFPDRVGDISNAATMVAKAAMGNWEHLADNIGMRAENIKKMSQEILSQKLDATGLNATMKGLEKQFLMVEKGTKGTTEYKKALIDILGTVFKGANAERFNTIGGAVSNLTDIMERFYQKVAGFSQVEGDFFNRIKDTIQKTVYGKMEEFYTVTRNGVTENTNALQALDRIATRIGNTFASLWGTVDTAAGGVTEKLIGYIKTVDAFFEDYQNKVAPFILYLYLVKLQVQDFFKGLADGFKATFGFYWKFAGVIVDMYTKFFNLFSNENKSRVYGIGAAIGHLVGAIAGLKIVTILLSPLRTLFSLLQSGFSSAKSAFAWFGTATGEGGLITRGLTMLRTGFSALIPLIRGVGVALTANPIGATIMAVAAGLFLVWNYWEEIKGAIDAIPSSVGVLIAVFAPVVGIPLLILKNWDTFKTGFINIWEGINGFISGTWTYLKLGFRMTVDWILGAWNKVKSWFVGFKDWLKTNFYPAFQVFEFIGKKIDEWLIQPLSKAWDYLTKIWDKIGDNIIWLWEQTTGWFKDAGQQFEQGAKAAEDAYNRQQPGQQQSNSPVPGSTGYNSIETFRTISSPVPAKTTNTTDSSIGYNIQNLNMNIKADKGFDVDGFKKALQDEIRQSVG
jgi:hypothetical protein